MAYCYTPNNCTTPIPTVTTESRDLTQAYLEYLHPTLQLGDTMDQVQWALKELSMLREEHQKLGLRVAQLEKTLLEASVSLQPEDGLAGSNNQAPKTKSDEQPVVPPLNVARARDSILIQAHSPALPSHLSSPPLDSAKNKLEADVDSTRSELTESEATHSANSNVELTSPQMIEELCSSLYSAGVIRGRVEIGLVAKPTPSMRHYREDPCAVINVTTGENTWYISKTFNQLKSFDTALRSFQQNLPQLPSKDQWQSYSPIKIDIRVDLFNSYLAQVQEIIQSMPPTSHSVYLQFMSTDIVQMNSTVFCGFLVSKSRFSGWKPRFCVLNGPVLDILDKPGGSIGQSINLARAVVSPIPDNFTGSDDEYRNGITILEHKENSSKTNTHYFSCESEQSRAKWLTCIKNSSILPKVGPSSAATPFVALRDSPNNAELDSNSVSFDSTTSAASIRERPSRRDSSLTIDSRFQGYSEGSVLNRKPSPQAAIAITQPTSGPTSALASHRRVFSPPANYPNSPLSGPGTPSFQHGAGTQRTSVFRVPLPEALGYSSMAVGKAVVPTLVGRCIEFLYSHNAYLEEGLFRISGTQSQVDNLELRFERDEVDIDDLSRNNYDVHVVSSVLKRYLRLLPEPLIPYQEEAFWADLMSKNHKDLTAALSELVHSVPQENYDLLDLITQFLEEVRRNSAVNKMTPQNLGIVFSPTLGIPGPVIIALIEDQSNIFSS